MNRRTIAYLIIAAAIAAPVLRPGLTAHGEKAPVQTRDHSLPHKYSYIAKRNIFGFMPRSAAAETPAVSAQSVKIDVPPIVERNPLRLPPVFTQTGPSFSLTGTMKVGNKYKAIIEEKSTGNGHYVSENGKVGDYTVIRISLDEAVLEKGSDKITLKMDRSRATPLQVEDTLPGELTPAMPPDMNKLPMNVQPRIGR